MARVRINDTLSEPFPLFHGTWQECQFALALEPLAAMVWASPSITGFRGGQGEEKISLYVDNTLLYLGDTEHSLRAVMHLTDQFGQLSGFAINWPKSALLPLDPLPAPLPVHTSGFLI